MASSDFLIDLSTPRPVAISTKPRLYPDLTPSLTKALTQNYTNSSRRGTTNLASSARQLFPPAKCEVSPITEDEEASSDVSSSKTMTIDLLTDADDMPSSDIMDYILTENLTQTLTNSPTDILTDSPEKDRTSNQPFSLKRPPSTPITPRACSKLTQKRRVALQDKSNSILSDLTTPIGKIQTPTRFIDANDIKMLQLSARVEDCSWDLLSNENSSSISVSVAETPDSVRQIRRKVSRAVTAKRHNLSKLRDSESTQEETQEEAEEEEEDSSMEMTDSVAEEEPLSTHNLLDPPQCSCLSTTVAKLLLEKDYEARLYKAEIASWQDTVRFLELEKQFGL